MRDAKASLMTPTRVAVRKRMPQITWPGFAKIMYARDLCGSNLQGLNPNSNSMTVLVKGPI